MEEIWKDVKGYEGIYKVSNLGRVKSFKKQKEKILKGVFDPYGYLSVMLYKNAKGIRYRIHRLVATNFLGESNLVVNHKNLNIIDNRLENLEFVSIRENISHSHLNKKTSSKYTGVSWNKRTNKWVSLIQINGKQRNLGYFNSEIDAHNAYLKALEENNLANKYSQ